jgi:hypothetical protein
MQVAIVRYMRLVLGWAWRGRMVMPPPATRLSVATPQHPMVPTHPYRGSHIPMVPLPSLLLTTPALSSPALLWGYWATGGMGQTTAALD